MTILFGVVKTRQTWLTVLTVVTALSLAALVVWSVRLVIEVQGLRSSVVERVGWLQQIDAARRAIERGDASDKLDWAQRRETLTTIAANVSEPGAHSETGSSMESRLAIDLEAPPQDPTQQARIRDDLDILVAQIRRETAGASKGLGEKWNSLNLLVVTALFFATTTLGLLVYVRSWTRGNAADQVATLHERLRVSESLAAVGTLAAGVAHEINNPLTYVTTNLQLLREELECSAADLTPLVDDALGGASRVGSIVRALETVGPRPGSEGETSNVRDALEAALAAVPMDGVATIQRAFETAPMVPGEITFLTEVFRHLVDNARRVMEETPGREHVLSVWVDTDEIGMARATVHGLPAEVRNRIFQPFVTTRDVDEGKGLGLYVCHGVVTALGGRVEIDSNSRGTSVTVYLPPAEAMQPANAAPPLSSDQSPA